MGFLLGGLKIIYWFFYIVFAIDLIAFSSKIIFYPNTVSSYGFWWFCFLYTLSPFLYFCRGFFQDFICSINIGGLKLNEYKLGAFIFAIIGIFLFYFFFVVHSNKQDEFSFTVKPNRAMPDFLCKANTFYEINAEHGIRQLKVNNTFYNVPDSRRYAVIFDEDTNLGIQVFTDGVWFKSANIKINKMSSIPTPNTYSILIYLTPNKYSNYALYVNKGSKIDFITQNELFYLGSFNENNLLNESLIRKDNISYWFFKQNKIRFKAAEVPFFLYLKNFPYSEEMEVNVENPESNIYNIVKHKLNAIYLEKGDTIKTNFWLDAGDSVKVKTRPFSELVYSVNNKIITQITHDYDHNYCFDSDVDGYLSFSNTSINDIVITKIIINRRKTWELNLKDNETFTINLESGDILNSKSSSRYYVNDSIMEADKTYKISRNGDITFKASVDPQPIKVSVAQRRGY